MNSAHFESPRVYFRDPQASLRAVMKRSETKILTTHVGSLPGRGEIAAAKGEADVDDIRAVIAAQRDAGIDIVNEGEFTKGGDWLSLP